jgi:hypothetical protein
MVQPEVGNQEIPKKGYPKIGGKKRKELMCYKYLLA